MTRSRVVVVDDLRPMLDAVTALLRDAFDIVGTACDGQAALQSILALQPSLVVMDISMPRMSGVEVARELNTRASKAKIVFLTGHHDPAILEACVEVGGLAYVLKDSMDRDLIFALHEAVAGRSFVSQFASPRNPR